MSSSGEGLYFSNTINVINAVELPLLEGSTTYGRYPNGTGAFITMWPSYNAENSYTALSVESSDVFETNVLVSVYPNPTIDNITLHIDGEDEVEFSVYNLSGQLVFNDIVIGSKILSLQDWGVGVYLLVIPDFGKTIKIIKK